MKEDIFSFFRGASFLFYYDFIKGGKLLFPPEWNCDRNAFSWIVGDAHLKNFGFFGEDDDISFGINDFDEALIAPFYYDLARFLSSIIIFVPQLGFNLTDRKVLRLIKYFLKIYIKSVSSSNRTGLKGLKGFLGKREKKLIEKIKKKHQLKKWTIISDGRLSFNFDLEKLKSLNIDEYDKLKIAIEKKFENLNVFDLALRIDSGLGAYEMKKYYALCQDDGSFFILEIKEQRASSLTFYDNNAYEKMFCNFKSDAERSDYARKILVENEKTFNQSIKFNYKSFLIKKRSNYKFSFDGDHFKKRRDFKNFLLYSARKLSNYHQISKEDKFVDKGSLKDFFKKHKSFKKELINRALQYTKILKTEYEIFKNIDFNKDRL